jgi:hypothetical protein
LPAPGRTDREAVEVVAPAVPAGDDRPDQLTVGFGQDRRVRVPGQQRQHGVPRVGRTAVVLGRLYPQRQQVIDIGSGSRAQDEGHSENLTPCRRYR